MPRKPSKRTIMAAIAGSNGIVTVIARRLGVSWSTAKLWIDSDDTLRRAWQDERETLLDSAEAVLAKKILQEQDDKTAKWVLANLGKERGYGKRVELTGADGGPVEIADAGLTDDERVERIAAILDRARARATRQAANTD